MTDLVKKWSLTGLLDEIEDKSQYRGAEVLERTAQQILSEVSSDSRDDDWNAVSLSLIIKIFARTGTFPNYNLVKSLYCQVRNLIVGSRISLKPNINDIIEKMVCELYVEKEENG